mmetsp:Transcript_90703/g.143371  ORF Transcript_90703/g.143371 Transcript_90703/m.143371 type:complete len:301 (-) Transcript_90703:45-947(-)
MCWVSAGILALLFHANAFGVSALVLTAPNRDVQASDARRLPSLPLLAAVAKVQHLASRQSPGEQTENDTEKTLMEKINKIGRDLCKERPNHPKCQQFKDKPKPAKQEVTPETTLAPQTSSTTIAVTTPPFGVLDSWGRASRTVPTVLPPVEGARGETLPSVSPASAATANKAPVTPAAKGTEIKNWGKGEANLEHSGSGVDKEKPAVTAEPKVQAPAEPEVEASPTNPPVYARGTEEAPTTAEPPAMAEANADAEAAARQEAIADVASSRPAQMPERQPPSAPTSPPRKVTAEQRAAKLP